MTAMHLVSYCRDHGDALGMSLYCIVLYCCCCDCAVH